MEDETENNNQILEIFCCWKFAIGRESNNQILEIFLESLQLILCQI